MAYIIHIGDTPYSSWSLRGWLLLAAFDLPCDIRLHRMYDPAFAAFQRAAAPARTVPTLEWDQDGQPVRVWDSLAIAETLAERHPAAGHWPEDPAARAAARSLAAEMHSGFVALRQACPMNVRRKGVQPRAFANGTPESVATDLSRLAAIWAWARGRWGAGGPFLFGARFTAADVFFAPVAFRVVGYGLVMEREALDYVAALLAHPSVAAWRDMAFADERFIEDYERI
ncbi:MAG: glutathione S-transferase [Rubrimonas sp.]